MLRPGGACASKMVGSCGCQPVPGAAVPHTPICIPVYARAGRSLCGRSARGGPPREGETGRHGIRARAAPWIARDDRAERADTDLFLLKASLRILLDVSL
eukprot:scaffold12815_cov69-Phaeocystis_antarctica.AAC.10